MAAAATPYVAWMGATAQQAELAAFQALTAAGAYAAAFAMTVPPPEILANRTLLMTLIATNFLGQNTPAIAATEAQYAEMWAQDAVAMYGYAASSAAATAQVTPFTAAPQTTNMAGVAAQGAASAQAAGSSTGTGVQSALSQLMSSFSGALQSLASPSSSTSGLSGLLSGLLGGSSSASDSGGFLGGLSGSGFSLGGLAEQYATIPGWFSMFMAEAVLSPLIGTPMSNAFNAAGAAGAAGATGAADVAGAAEGAMGAAGSGFGGGLGGLAGLGQAAEVGGLSVPASWGWSAAGLPAMAGSVPLGMPAAAAVPLDVGAGLGFPFMFPGLPQGAGVAAGAGAIAGAAAAKYGSRLKVVARPPAAGYPAADPAVVASTPKYPPIPAGFPTNGHTPPGYQAAVIYLPTNGHAPADK